MNHGDLNFFSFQGFLIVIPLFIISLFLNIQTEEVTILVFLVIFSAD